ncbi:MAG: hypothetical protein ABID63_13815 [Pseudomonadota bacterium]
MNIKEFEDLLDQHGWDIASWPEPFRQEANKFVAQNDEAAELIHHLQMLEEAIAADALPMGRHRAIDNIFVEIDRQEQAAPVVKTPWHKRLGGTFSSYRLPYVAPVFGMTMCVLFGFVFGVVFTANQDMDSSADAGELPVMKIVDQHFYDVETILPGDVTPGPETGGGNNGVR